MINEFPAKNTLLLELHVPSFEITKEFYENLGFKVVWARNPEGFKGYLVMSLEDNILCFWAGNENVYEQDYFKKWDKNTKRGYGVEIVLMVEDIAKFYNEVKSRIEIFEKLQKRPWGLEDFRIEDPFGYYLRFTSRHNMFDDKYAVS
ncbi:MAG: VOC family protein [bacterium]|nr:VOC family protein [bacterium]